MAKRLAGRARQNGGTRAPFSGFPSGGWTDGGLRLPLCENRFECLGSCARMHARAAAVQVGSGTLRR